MKPQTVEGLLMYLRTQCTGTRTSGCACPTCVLYVDVQHHAVKRAKRLAEIASAEG